MNRDQLRTIGPFPNVMQIALSIDQHELLKNPVTGAIAGGTLTFHNGKLIDQGRGRLFNVYLGGWGDVSGFDAFSKALVEYGYYISPDGLDRTQGKFLGSTKVTYPFPGTVDDAQIAGWVDQQVSAGVFPPQDGYTEYSLIFPSGTVVTMGGVSSGNSFCGYHTRTRLGNYYQVICDSNAGGCHGNFTPHQAREMIQAHEWGEFRSDPDGTGWWSDTSGMENGDECAWMLVNWGPLVDAYSVQPLAVQGACSEGLYAEPPPLPPPPPNPLPKTVSGVTVTYTDGTSERFLR